MSISHYLVISLCIHNRIWVIGWPHKVNQQLLWSWMKWGRCNLNTCKNFITGVKNNSRFAITNITTAGVNLSTILLILTTLKMLFLWNLETTAMQQSMDGGAPVVRGCDISIHIHYSLHFFNQTVVTTGIHAMVLASTTTPTISQPSNTTEH